MSQVAVTLGLLVAPLPALANGAISVKVVGKDLVVTTEPNAVVVMTLGTSKGVSRQAYPQGLMTISLSDVPVGSGQRLTISELTPVVDRGSQSQSSFHFVPGSGLSVGNHFYIATSISFTNTDQIDADIALTYGSSARLARWEDLAYDSTLGSPANFAKLFLNAIALPVEGSVDCRYPSLYVSSGGQEFDGARGRYFVSNFAGSSPSECDYAAFGNISNSIFLGSYSWPGQALVYIPRALYQPSVAASTSVIIPPN
jgi:hypothetical protein